MLEWVPMLAVVFVAMVLGEMLTPLKRLDEQMGRHRGVLVGATAGAATLGFVFFMGGILYRLMLSDRTEFHDAASFREVKAAWRQRAWRASSRWRGFFVIGGGAMLMGLGLFAVFFVIGPPFVKLLVGAAVVYATVRTAWGFWRA